jgi:hypothetical protein
MNYLTVDVSRTASVIAPTMGVTSDASQTSLSRARGPISGNWAEEMEYVIQFQVRPATGRT